MVKIPSIWRPTIVTSLVLVCFLSFLIRNEGGDPLSLARLGTKYSMNDPNGTEGYDGQFVYYIARYTDPSVVTPYLDVPAYRYQRILLPLTAKAISFGNVDVLPWMLVGLGVLSQAFGTLMVTILLKQWNLNPWFALVYGLWVGFVLAVRLVLPEPMAYALVAAAIVAAKKDRLYLSWVFYSLALFAKEVTILFVFAQLIIYLWDKDWRRSLCFSMFTLLPFGVFQIWLWINFGQIGLASGGAMATGFEVLPLMGMLRIGAYSPVLLIGTLVVFGPFLILPALWSLWFVSKRILNSERNIILIATGIQASSLLFLPFSTFRETGGLLRYSCGIVMLILFLASKYKLKRVLRYAPLWLVLNVFLLKS